MKTSIKGILEIAEHEGVVPAPYRDSVGVWTFGVGHTAAAGGLDPREMNSAMPATQAAINAAVRRAIEVFREDLPKYEARVNQAILGTKLSQHQFDALVSWDFNTGGATWKSRTGKRCQLIREIRAGDFSGNGFMGWLRPPEIRKRREAEQRLFRTGDYDANGDLIPIWKTNGKGRLIGRHGVLHGDELLRMFDLPPVADHVPEPQPKRPFFGGFGGMFAGRR